MSTIEKLSIRGIRSFGSKSEDVQTITFSSPVTLILGENGCGKTTIIECLKYALTGEAPPGSERGKNFVQDPKIYSLTESLGQIKLQVRNIRGERMSVCRTMKIALKRGKFAFETTDSTVNYMNENGEGIGGGDSISKRCVDVDAAMTHFMGVSKAIINNVLFCHQEDASWPLDEGKKLKEKFDAIFGITEYNKAIEKLIKMRKEEMDQMKIKEADLRFLEHLKVEMEDKTMALQKAQQKCAGIRDDVKRCEENMKPIEDRLQEIRDIEYNVGRYQAQKVESETRHKNCKEQIASLRKKIKKIFEGSIDDLAEEITAFDNKMLQKRKECKQMEMKLNALKEQDKTEQRKLTELDKKRVLLIQRSQNEQECNSKRADKMKVLCDHLNISLTYDLDQNPEEVPEVLSKIKSAMVSEQTRVAEKVAQFDRDDQQRQVGIDVLRVDLTKLEEAALTLRKQKKDYQQEFEEAAKKITEVEQSTQRLNKVTESLEATNKYYADTSAKFNQTVMRESIAASKEKVKTLQSSFRKIDERLTRLNAISKQTAEISLKETEVDKREQEVRRIKSKHSDNIRKVFGRTVEQNFKRTLQTSYETYRREIKDLNEKINKLKLQEQSFEFKRKTLKEEISTSEKQLKESEEKIYEKCHSTSYEELLAKSKAAVSKHQLELGALRSAEAMYKKYIQKVEEDPCCPLCHRGMTQNEAQNLNTELADEIEQLPANINRTEKELKIAQKKYETLFQLQPVIDKVARLEVDIPAKKEELKQIQAKLSECLEESETLQLLVAEPTSNLEVANSMLGDMSLLDEALKEVSRLKNDIQQLKSKLPEDHDSEASIEDLQLEKSTIQGELENEQSDIDKQQQKYEKTLDGLNKLRETMNKLKEEKIKLQESLQSLPQMKTRQAELSQLIDTSELKIVESTRNIAPLKQKLSTAIAEKARYKESNREIVSQMQSNLNSYKSIDHDIQRLHNEMKDYQEMNLGAEIERLRDTIKNAKHIAEDLNRQISTEIDAVEALKIDCLNAENLERDLRDNRELKVLQSKEKDISEECAKLSKQLGDLDFHKVSREKTQLNKDLDVAKVSKGALLGQIGEINNHVEKLEKEIEEPRYKDSLHNYRLAFYEVEVTRRMISDLEKFRKALEWSLMQFHDEKMKGINQLIREYWRLIYRGNDIDYIQILTDSDIESSSDRRRSYNYRVVQSKNNSEIEMRGRCSAGQRVLASLIIRMALAETFSCNCGVLALDEPTTNLDRNNIISLCEALNRIVEDRQTQTNFMLIIITHDEDFVSTLGKISSYHRVFRNDECKSVIRKVKVA